MDSKKAKMIVICNAFIDVISYFESVRLNDTYLNGYLIELCKKDLIGIRSGEIITRPYNIQDELVLGRIYEADKNDLLDLFNKKIEKAKESNAFKTHKAFAKYEYKYQKGVWRNNDIVKWIPIAKQWLRMLKEISNNGEPLTSSPKQKKAEILKDQLSHYGFFELEKIKILSNQSNNLLIEKISNSSLPYTIAMFDYLEFIVYLEKNFFDTKYKLNRGISKWFNSDKDGRSVKGNISSLLPNTTENKARYTAYKHKDQVIKDYEKLK